MRKCSVAIVVLCLAALAAAGPAQAAQRFRPRIRAALGLAPTYPQSQRGDIATGAQTPVLYHGGNVMSGGVTVHPFYWAPSGYSFSSGYTDQIDQFVADIAHDSGSTGNAFSVLPQFAEGTLAGHITPGAYQIAAGTSITDTTAYPSSGQCASPSGVRTCLTDAQVQAELDSYITAHGLPRGTHDLYYVFLPQDVDECIVAGACGTNAFGGYHSVSDLGHGVVIYAITPDPIIETRISQNAYPQNNSYAGAAIDVAAHEIVEAMTDPEGVGWMDPNGFEVADKCENGPQVGTTIGTAPNGSPYNQVINGHQYLLQEMWSGDDNGCVTTTTRTASPLPLPQVNLTQFSGTVSGNIGANTAGIGVRVTLERSTPAPLTPVTVAHASTVTTGNGAWSLSLGGHAVGDDRDVIIVHYSGTGAPAPAAQTILTGNGGNPFAESGWTGWTAMDQGSQLSGGSGSSGPSLTLAPCFQIGVLSVSVNGGTLPVNPIDFCNTQTDTARVSLSSPGRGSAVSFASLDNRAYDDVNGAAANANGGLVKLTVPVGEPDAVSPFVSPVDTFTPSGLPACAADLELRAIACKGLIPSGDYTVIDGAHSARATADSGGTAVTSLPVHQGDSVTLRNASRTLTTLHVARLRVDLTGEQAAAATGGSCEPAQWLGGPLAVAPTSAAAGGDPGTPGGAALADASCPADGNARGFPAASLIQSDEASGGSTQTEVPQIENTSPMDGETVIGRFTALAETGLPGPGGSVVPTARTSKVALSITPAAGGAPRFRAANVDTAGGVTVNGLAAGKYRAIWKLTDAAGDTRTITTRFIHQGPGAGGGGNTGPRPGVRCHRLDQRRIRCAISYSAAGGRLAGRVQLRLMRGVQLVGMGSGRLTGGHATVTLRRTRTVSSGRWQATVALRAGRTTGIFTVAPRF